MQRLNAIQGVRKKKSIALPRCISRRFDDEEDTARRRECGFPDMNGHRPAPRLALVKM
jgi:hypothetical protein